MNAAFICDALRTPIGRFGGALANVRADDLAAMPMRALLSRNAALDPTAIDDVFLGCANQAGEDSRNVARMAALLAGLPTSVPGVTLNRLCASGADAVASAARAIMASEIELAIAGGVESMSRAPYVMSKAHSAFARAQIMEDSTIGWRFVNPAIREQYGIDSMPQTAENLAKQYGISREQQDIFALQSQQRCALAQASGYFAEEIIPILGEPNPVMIDEHPRPQTTLAMLAALRPIVEAAGSVTAGNASGINDGAAAMLVATETAARRHGLTPRARILGMATAGVEPRVMGIGPVPACRKLLRRLGVTIHDFDIIEINEAFAAQVIASMYELDVQVIDNERINPHGGAIALGHPLGMSGARLILTAVHALEKTGGRRALVTMCIGAGQGLAIALERL